VKCSNLISWRLEVDLVSAADVAKGHHFAFKVLQFHESIFHFLGYFGTVDA
jgi:hypothetical protein